MGNFISKLFGSSKQETDKQAPKPQEAASKAISEYSGMTALQRREKAAGLKAGGMVKKCVTGGKISGAGGPTDDMVPIMASNGEFMIKASSAKILGPELLEALNDVGDEPKNPKDDAKEDAKEGMKCGGKVKKMAAGGMIRKMRGGGPVDEELKSPFDSANSPPSPLKAQPSAPLTVTAGQIPFQSGAAGMLAQTRLGDQLIKGVDGQMRPTAQPAPIAPQATIAPPVPAMTTTAGQIPYQQGAIGGMFKQTREADKSIVGVKDMSGNVTMRPTAEQVQQPTQVVQPKAIAQQAAMNSLAATPAAPVAQAAPTSVDDRFMPGTRAVISGYADDASRNIKEGNYGALAGNTIKATAAMPLGIVEDVLRPLVSPTLGKAIYNAGSTAIGGNENSAGAALNTPTAKPVVPGATSPVAPQASANARQQRQGDPSSSDLKDEFSNAMIENRNPGGMVRKVVGPDGRTSYSGSNVTGEVSFQGADGNALRGRPGGGYLSTDTSAGYAMDKKLGDQMQSERLANEAAGFARQKEQTAANLAQDARFRASLKNPNHDENSRIDELVRKGMSVRGAANLVSNRAIATEGVNARLSGDQTQAETSMRGQDINASQVASQDKRYAQSNAMEQAKLGMSQTEHISKMAKEKQATDAQTAYSDPKATPEVKEAAKRTLIALGLLKTGTPTYHAGSKVTDSFGNQTVTEGTVFNPDTQEVRFVGNNQQGAAKATTQDEFNKMPSGTPFTAPDGSRRIKP